MKNKAFGEGLGLGAVKCEWDSSSHLVSFLLTWTIRVNGGVNLPQSVIKGAISEINSETSEALCKRTPVLRMSGIESKLFFQIIQSLHLTYTHN